MAYTNAWNEAAPLGSAQANTIDDIIRQFKLDIRERVAGIFGIVGAGFNLDPLVPVSLSLTGSFSADSIAGTLVTPAQTNITSVGVLSILSVSGSVTAAGSFVGNLIGNVSGNVIGNVTGNVSGSAGQLATPRAINGVNFDGTAAITVTAAAGTLTGATLAANVLASSLTSVGTLASLTVTNPITGSVTGGAAAGSLTGATLAAGVTASSLTSLGTIATFVAAAATFSGAVVFNGATSVQNGQSLVVGTNSISAANLILMGSPTTGSVAANSIVFTNDRGCVGANAANSIALTLIKMNASDQVELGAAGADIKWARTLTALGGGATPTLGTIGGSGPASAAQASWLPVRDSSGNARFIPIWG